MKATVSMLIGILILIAAAAPAGPRNLRAQGICIPKPLTVNGVKGRVLFEASRVTEPLSDVSVEIAPYGYQNPPLSKVMTATDGRFDLKMIAPGRYYLSIQHSAIIGMRVEIRVRPPKKGSRPSQDIEFVLRNDPGKACGGGTVSLATPVP